MIFCKFKKSISAAVIHAAIALCLLPATPVMAGEKSHGLSSFGDLKQPKDFKHFAYVNPNAPKGGTLSMIGTAGLVTFNSLNMFILKGDAAQGMQYVFDTLMVRGWDEPDAEYGLVAHSAELSDDKKSVTFYLRPQAKFSDGTPLTAQDVVFSFDILKKEGDPVIALQLRDVEKAEAIGTHTVRYTFKGEQIRDLPLIVALLPILSKAYYSTHPFNKTTLDPPLGSGPYKVAKLKQGTFIIYKRREDYWAKDLNVNIGRYNFDVLRYEYYRERTTEFEAFKTGQFDLREEFTSKVWATEYNIKPVKNGQIILSTLPDDNPSGAQGFFMNTRREKFSDPRVRQAFDLVYDFEWANKNLFFNLYNRTQSFFENSQMKASGKPNEAELALLSPYKDKLPGEVFGEVYTPPVTDGSGRIRKNRRKASKLLTQAGWKIKDGKRTNAKDEIFTVQFLIFSPSFERVISPFVNNLKLLGIDASIRRVDPAQFQERMKSFDFDISTRRYVMPNTPGTILRNYWGSASADVKGSLNLSGIKDPVVDELIEKVIAARNREDMTTAARALDRVLRAGHYWIPHWYKAAHNIAHWNKFSAPKIKPRFNRGIIETWWFDKEKAAALAASR